MSPRVLVACVGNIFLGDDGFGSEVARRFEGVSLPEGVSVVDYGIRAVHLSYDLLVGYDAVVVVDVTQQGQVPGTVSLFEPLFDGADEPGDLLVDGHSVTAETVLAMIDTSPARPGRVLVVGCEPVSLEEGIGLSEPVAAAVDTAARMVESVVGELMAEV